MVLIAIILKVYLSISIFIKHFLRIYNIYKSVPFITTIMLVYTKYRRINLAISQTNHKGSAVIVVIFINLKTKPMSTLKEINMRDVRGYSEMIRYLSELSGKPLFINIPIEKWEDTCQVRYCIYKGNVYQIGKRLLKGNIPCYTLNQKGIEIMTLPIEHKFENMFYVKPLGIDEFGIEYKILPNACKWDEGNGTYSMQDVYVIKNKMFIKI